MSKIIKDPDILDRLKKVEQFQRDAENGTQALRPDPRFLPDDVPGPFGTTDYQSWDWDPAYGPSPFGTSIIEAPLDPAIFGVPVSIWNYIVVGGIVNVYLAGGARTPGVLGGSYYDYDTDWWRVEMEFGGANYATFLSNIMGVTAHPMIELRIFGGHTPTGFPMPGYSVDPFDCMTAQGQLDASGVWQFPVLKSRVADISDPFQIELAGSDLFAFVAT